MKRINHIFEKICSIENLELADERARKGKRNTYGVRLHDKNKEVNLVELHTALLNQTFKTSVYETFKIYEPKERLIFRLPYYPDRIVHHAIMNVIKPIFVNTFTHDTYSCIEGRGIHLAVKRVKNAVRATGSAYCLKIDISKFYPSVDHNVLKSLLRRKFKDARFLNLVDGIIDSADGLPIGNYLSQYLSNYMLCYLDHKVKEEYRVTHYFRYADDMVFLSDSKSFLHELLIKIRGDLEELKLEIKGNYRIFPTRTGIDFLGYVFYPTHTLLRKSIKKNMAKRFRNEKSRAAYKGWCDYCDSENLIKTLYERIT